MASIKFNDFDESIKQYFNNLKNFKPLKKKDERVLLEDYLQNGNINARNILIQSNLKYACTLANSYRGKGVELSELISEANNGLIESIDKYDLSKNVKVITYAKWWIIQRLNNCVVSNYKALTDDLPTDHEKQHSDINNDEHISHHTTKECEHFIADEIDNENNLELKQTISELLDCLNERERDFVEMYYGINGSYYNLEDIGNMYNITKERTRQIIEKSLLKVRSNAMLMERKVV